MGFFSRLKARGDGAGAKHDAEVQRLRARWDEYASKMPPVSSQAPRAVEFRAKVAEYDLKITRFLDALAIGNAGGLAAPGPRVELMGDLGLLLADDVIGAEEGAWFVSQSAKVDRIVQDAVRLQKSGR